MSSTASATLTLTNYAMDSAADADAFASYVTERISGLLGFAVLVEQAPADSDPTENRIRGASDTDRAAIFRALQFLWDAWVVEPTTPEMYRVAGH